MPAPRTPHEAVLQAARDVARLDTAFEAELLGSALLGSVYAIGEGDRAAVVRDFVGGFLEATARRRSPAATTIRATFAALVPDAPGAVEVTRTPPAAPWAGRLGQVRPTGAYAYGDVYGDQTSYLATFAYEDPAAGGPEHAAVVLVDHNIGAVKDLFVGPAEPIVSQVRALCAADDETWFEADVPPERLRAAVDRHLTLTDSMASLPDEDSLVTDRAIVGARLALLPEPGLAEGEPEPLDAAGRAALTADFLASAEAGEAGLGAAGPRDRTSRDFAISLVLDHADTFPDLDPLRWSPVMAELFLLDWVHRRAVLDEADAAMLPRVLRAWVAYAARRRGVPAGPAARTVAAVDELAPEFARVYASGERRSPATDAVSRLLAEGVDPADADAVTAWLRANPN
jgi:hypothetical protein